MSDPLSPDDAACLRMLAGANFGPDANVTLPSGRTLGAAEMQALTSAYAPPTVGPATRAYLDGGGDPDNDRAMGLVVEADRARAARESTNTPEGKRRRWWQR